MNKDFYTRLLESHIIQEFIHGVSIKDLMLETRSIVPNIDFIVSNIYKSVSKQLYFTLKNKENTTKAYTEKDINISDNFFFKEIKLTVSFTINNNTHYKGNFDPIKSFKVINGKYIFIPNIDIFVMGNSFDFFYKTFMFSLSHELTHAYNYFMYYTEHGFPESKEQILKTGLGRQNLAMQGSYQYEQAIGNILYRLSRRELNAHLGQLRQELLQHKDKIIDSKSAIYYVKQSESYNKNFAFLKRNIENICNITNESVQNDIIFFTNMIANKNFSNYKQVKKFFLNKWLKFYKNYITKASKIVYDVFEENSNPIVYDDFSKNINITN